LHGSPDAGRVERDENKKRKASWGLWRIDWNRFVMIFIGVLACGLIGKIFESNGETFLAIRPLVGNKT
jgi:hypothetical protein